MKQWTNEAKEELQDCFHCTDWIVFFYYLLFKKPQVTWQNSETLTSYIIFCEGVCVPAKTSRSFNSNKLWFTARWSQLWQAKARKTELCKTQRNIFTKEIRAATQKSSKDDRGAKIGEKAIEGLELVKNIWNKKIRIGNATNAELIHTHTHTYHHSAVNFFFNCPSSLQWVECRSDPVQVWSV